VTDDADRALSGGASVVLVALPDGGRAAAIARALAAEHLMPVMAFTTDALLDFAADRLVSAVVVDPAGLTMTAAPAGRPAGRQTGADPGSSGLVDRVRAVTAAPIVVLGFVPGDGRGPTGDRVDGLLGGDASAADVVGTVLTAIARGGPADEVVACAELVVDLRNYEAWQGTRRLALTPTELRLLGVLVAAQGDVVTKHDLQKAAWGSAGAHDDNRLQAHMRRLRHKLARSEHRAAGVRTVRGVGFRLEPAVVAAETAPPGDKVHEPTQTGARTSGRRR
jgi:DNA-binding winged helix-turn-helix (wHTH) protein